MINSQNYTIECKSFSWKPVIAGALVAIGLSFLLNLFSVAISLTAFTTSSEGVEKLALGGLIATALGIIASMFASGWIAGHLGTYYGKKAHLGALYGFLTWCVALIFTIFLTTHIHDYVNYYSHFISGSTAYVSVSKSGAELAVPAPATNQLVISAYIIFSLFFLSAFACSLGGHCGMWHECKKECP
jgi:hypothetical protein